MGIVERFYKLLGNTGLMIWVLCESSQKRENKQVNFGEKNARETELRRSGVAF